MPPQIRIAELRDMQNKKIKSRTLCFDKILELIHRRIRTVASYNGENTFYEIPGIMIGYPLYNLNECMDYIIDALKKNGFFVQILPPPHIAVLYVSWSLSETKPVKTKMIDNNTFSSNSSNRLLLNSKKNGNGNGNGNGNNQKRFSLDQLKLF